CSTWRKDNSINLCTQPYDFMGMHYANLADACTREFGPGWGMMCTVKGQKDISVPYLGTYERTTPVQQKGPFAGPVETTWKDLADGVWRPGQWALAAFVNMPPCPLRPEQSHGWSLAKVASGVFPLCQDPAPAWRSLEAVPGAWVDNQFPLALHAD